MLNGSFGNVTSLDSSLDFIVAGSDNDECILFWNSLYPYKKEAFSSASGDVNVVDITENGKKILAIDASGKARIYKRKDRKLEFTLLQTLNGKKAGAISDNGKKLFCSEDR